MEPVVQLFQLPLERRGSCRLVPPHSVQSNRPSAGCSSHPLSDTVRWQRAQASSAGQKPESVSSCHSVQPITSRASSPNSSA
jgi:hypothetical protein